MRKNLWPLLLLPLALLSGACATSQAAWPSSSRIIELAHPLSADMPVFPGEPHFSAKAASTVEKDGYFLQQLELGEHMGTHVDAPAHFVPGALTVDKLSPEVLMGPAAVVDVSAKVAANPDYAVSAEDILAWEREHGPLGPQHLVLFHTGWASRWSDEQRYRNTDAANVMHFPGLSVAASQLLRQRQVRGLGIDTLSMDPGPSTTFEEHKDFLSGGGYHLENLADLSQLPPTGAFLMVSPLFVKDGSGSPARVFAFLPQDK